MTPTSAYAALAGAGGRSLMAALEGYTEERAAAAAARARSLAPPELAAAALATAFARRRARASGKFDHPESMLFTHRGYEQSSSSAVAAHRAQRFAGIALAYDLCCGIGSDASAIACFAGRVVAVDVDDDVLACAAHNAQAAGVGEKVRFERADALAVPLGDADAAFADPSRRTGEARTFDGRAYEPELGALLRRAAEVRGSRLCVKVAPGTDPDSTYIRESSAGVPIETEFVSERGVCKEAVLWCGAFARADRARRATVIDRTGVHALDGDRATRLPVGAPAAYIGEPDPAVIRSGLIAAACAPHDAVLLDGRVAYVTADAPAPGPFVRWYRVLDVMPFGLKRLRAYLRDRGVGRLIVKTRAFPLRPEALMSLLRPAGDGQAALICTTIGKRKTVVVCEDAR